MITLINWLADKLIPHPEPYPATAMVFNDGAVEAPYRVKMVDSKQTPIWEVRGIEGNPINDLINRAKQEEPAFLDPQLTPLIVTVEDHTT